MIWVAIGVTALGCAVLKYVGLAAPAPIVEHPRVQRIAGLIPAGMLAALVAVQTAAVGQSLTLDARFAGLAVAAVALLLRAPFLVVVVLGAATAALLRAL